MKLIKNYVEVAALTATMCFSAMRGNEARADVTYTNAGANIMLSVGPLVLATNSYFYAATYFDESPAGTNEGGTLYRFTYPYGPAIPLVHWNGTNGGNPEDGPIVIGNALYGM